MNANTIWYQAWVQLDRTFKHIAEQVREHVPNLIQSSGRTDNETFPFRAYATFRNVNKVIDLSIDCKRETDHWTIWADIARENGEILADFPRIHISSIADEVKLKHEILEVVRRIQSFLEQHIEMLGEELA